MAEEEAEPESFPLFKLAQDRFRLLQGTAQAPDKTKEEILKVVMEKGMLPFYEKFLCPAPLGPPKAELMSEMKAKNEEELAKIEEKIKDAKENLGDMEIRDALLAKANFYNRIGDKDAALEAYQVAFEKTVGVGGKLDNILTVIRIAFFFDDVDLAKREIDRAKVELGKGGDWERRNKLKVYEGIYLMLTREFKQSALLFLNVMPTFTATELVEFKDFVFYAVLLSLLALDRKTLREKVVSSPEVLSVVRETPHLQEFLDSFFHCKYHEFMEQFVHIIDHVRADRYMSRHLRHYMRMMRLNAYKQFLASYRSVTLDAMAQAFGVSSSFIDSELSSFIASGKLTCKIDKVGGVVESNESDKRSQVYVDIIKQGDLLLNKMQKCSGAIDM